MDFQTSIRTVLGKYADFSGRAQRSEYWWFFLFSLIVGIVLSVIDGAIGILLLGSLFSLAMLLPSLAVGARRLHDRDMSGWFLLLALIPLVGMIILLVLFCQKGTAGANRFGDDPLA